MAERVEIEIIAKDSASDTIKDVTNSVSGMDSAFGEITTGALREFGANMLPMVGGVISGTIDVFKGFVDVAVEAETVQLKLNSTLSSLGDTTKISAQNINDMADSLSKISGFDDEDLVNAQSTLLMFAGSLPLDMFERAVTLATDLAAKGFDLNTAFTMVGRMLQDPEAGFGRAALKIGQMTDAEKELIATMLSSGDVLGAQAALLDALEGKVGGAAETMGSGAEGTMNKFANAIENIQQAIGDALLPALAIIGPILVDMAEKFNAFVSSDQFQTWLTDVITYLTSQLIPALQQFGDWFINTGVPALANLTESSAGFIASIEKIKAVFDLLMALNPMTWFTNLAGEIKKAAGEIGVAFNTGIIAGIQATAGAVITAIVNVISQGLAAVKTLLGIQSPSKVFAEIGKNMMLGMGQGISANANFPITAMTGASAALVPAAGGGGGGYTIVYSPAMSLGNREEFEQALVPLLDSADRRRRR